MGDIDHYQIEFYVSARGESFIDDFMDEIPDKHRGKVLQWMRQLEKQGPNLPRPYADILESPIRELRVQFGGYKYRFFYFFESRTIVMTHAILKKTGPIPSEEIERSNRLRIDWLNRNK